ncbi:CLUMA_CG014453, isoform A [Clunio marinus]|uniref:Cytokine-like nuclear factor N-PAC n=1 Tax=Clunio marinus TaxID=568069 RepID=A0A1J1IN33_9DIPT|nr:CLUMA_CG014453, isoform A [Clunio marinus]
MAAKNKVYSFNLGDLVWAKMPSYCFWPGRIVEPNSPQLAKMKKSPTQNCIFFFGSNNYAWIEEKMLRPYLECRDEMKSRGKPKDQFQQAMIDIESFIENPNNFSALFDQKTVYQRKKVSPKPKKQDPEFDFDSLKSDSSVPSSPNVSKTPQSTPVSLKRSTSARSNEKPKVAEKTPKVPAAKRKVTNDLEPTDATETEDLPTKKPRKSSITPVVAQPYRNIDLITPDSHFRSGANETTKIKSPLAKVEASPTIFGFIGLGIMGRSVLCNLLESGHSVVIHNRTMSRCDEFLERYSDRCSQALSPKDVFEQAQITFVCVSDSYAVKETIMDGQQGVFAADNVTVDKGLVMLSSIDCETSRDIANAMMMKPVRYLEAQIQGSRNQAKEGSLIIIAAGDKSLFDDCYSCFKSIAKDTNYLGEEIESAVKMNLVLQTMAGVQLAAVSEAFALANTFDLQLQDILEIIDISNLNSPFIMEKGNVIISENYRDPSMKVETMQKDLKMAIDFGDSLEHPLPLATAANEILKTAKRLGLRQDDIASIFIASNFHANPESYILEFQRQGINTLKKYEMEGLNVGDFVWAKMKGFPAWPGRVVEPNDSLQKLQKAEKSKCIYFFGSHNHAWIEDSNIKPYNESKDQMLKLGKGKASFAKAIKEIEDFMKDPNASQIITTPARQATTPKIRKSVPNEVHNADVANESLIDDNETNNSPKKNLNSKLPVTKRSTQKKARPATPKSNDETEATPEKRSRSSASSPTVNRSNHNNNNIDNPSEVVPKANYISTPVPRARAARAVIDRPEILSQPEKEDLDVSTITQTLLSKNIKASDKKFGFIGLGNMGSGIVKNLLHSGHLVYVWNRSEAKAKKFEIVGAKRMLTPSDVIEHSDITFSCVSDPIALQNTIFGQYGVSSAQRDPDPKKKKGYVEMTTIDTSTSKDIESALNGIGISYLEAQIQGTKAQAQEGKLILLAAGDKDLFDNCQTCFEAMGRNSFFVGETGNATKMNLVLQTITGVQIAGLSDSIALAERAGIATDKFMDILSKTDMRSDLLMEKGTAMVNRRYNDVNLPLMHMQKDLRLAINMADGLDLPMPLTAIANEVYKNARRSGLAEGDASAICYRARH